MPDLSTTYLGMKLKNPLVPSASPLARDLDTPRRLEDAGAAAIVMDSLFEEQVIHDMEELDSYTRNPIGDGEDYVSFLDPTGTIQVLVHESLVEL